MAKREPYIIHENLTVQEIVDLVKRAYDEGFADGKKESEVITCPNYGQGWTITTPLKEIQIPNNTPVTPNDWPPNVIYCENSRENFKDTKTTFKG